MNEQSETKQTTFVCPKCANSNISIQVVNESQLVTKHHSIIWWIFIGWWWIFIKWLILTIPALIFKIFGIGKRQKIKNILCNTSKCKTTYICIFRE